MRNDRGGVALTAERLMKRVQQLRQLEAEVLNVLCDLGYRDDSKVPIHSSVPSRHGRLAIRTTHLP